MLQVAMGQSEDPDNESAINEVIEQCDKGLAGKHPKAGLLFASISYDFEQVLKTIRKKYPNIQLAGCSSFGEMTSLMGVSEDSIALLLFVSDDVDIYAGMAEDISKDAYKSLQDSLKKTFDGQLKKKPELCILMPDGLKSNVTDALGSLQDFFKNKSFHIAGGNASDNWKFEKVYLFHNEEVKTDAAAYLVFTDPIKCSISLDHATNPIGEKHVVTKSSGNTVYTVDHKPVLDLYKYYLGERGPNFIYGEYPLSIFLDNDNEKFILRAPFAVDEKEGSMTFAGDVPQNSIVRIAKTNTKESTIDAAGRCTRRALSAFTGKKVQCAMVFSCAVRKENLGTDTYKEYDLIKKELPENTPIFGFYTYGEIGKVDPADQTSFYNHTIIIVLIGE